MSKAARTLRRFQSPPVMFWSAQDLPVAMRDFAGLTEQDIFDHLRRRLGEAHSRDETPHVSVAKVGYVSLDDVPPSSMFQSKRLPFGPKDPEAVERLIHDALRSGEGFTLFVNHLQLDLPAAKKANQLFERICRRPSSANLYVTPAGSGAYGAHYDEVDNFILQVSGSKEWFVTVEPQAELPLDSGFFSEDAFDQLPKARFRLEKGEGLYVPAGHGHLVKAPKDSNSMHVTFGIDRVHWLQTMKTMFAKLQAELPVDVENYHDIMAALGNVPEMDKIAGRDVWTEFNSAVAAGEPLITGRDIKCPNAAEWYAQTMAPIGPSLERAFTREVIGERWPQYL